MTILRRVSRSPEGVAGLVILLTVTFAGISAPFVFPNDPLSIVAAPLIPPFTDRALPLGTDTLGRDVLACLFHAVRSSFLVGLSAAAAALLIGTFMGTIAGFAGGIVDEALMRIADAFQIVPSFLLALAFVSTVGPSLPIVVMAIALGAWADPARLTRAQVLSIRERDYVAAARTIGMHPMEIAFRQILPNAVPPVMALAAIIVAAAILTEAALSFLGLGDPNIVTWGGMIAEGRNVLRSAAYLSIIPGVALLATVLGVYLLGEGINKALAFQKGVQ
ncbi:ABC transporter permease [uncultured Agrobacterium sp.]|uniref:ABC transporter permease n=1 Tax=uncultured Agrobacterium sp. TaxID=157277 RepID=UPI0025D9CE2E|nr:ABC transporter permease [uncultured Agrobacterium sp.]